MTIWDVAEAEALKKSGMERAAQARAKLIQDCKTCARLIARVMPDRRVTIDDVYLWLESNGVDKTALGPGAGSIFQGDEWEFTGYWTKSKRTSNHGRMIRVWRYVETHGETND